MRLKDVHVLFFVTAFAALVSRFFQFFYSEDAVTGFLKPEYKGIGIALISVVFLSVAAMLVAALTIRRCPLNMPKTHLSLGIVALFNAAAILFDIFSLPTNINIPAWQSSLIRVTGILAFLFFTALFLKSIIHFHIPGVCFAIPVLYYLVRLIYTFTLNFTLALIADNLFEIIAQVFVLLFIFQFAQSANNLGSEWCYKKIAAYGFSGAILCVVTSLPNLWAYISGSSFSARVDVSAELLNLTTALFIYCFLYRYFSVNKSFN